MNKHRYINCLLLAIDEPRIMHAYFNTCHSFKNRNAGTCFDLSSFSTCLPQLLTCQIGKMALISLRCWHIEPGSTLSRHVRSLQFLVFLVPWENRVQGSNAVHDKRIQAAQEMLAVQMQRTQWRSGESSYCSWLLTERREILQHGWCWHRRPLTHRRLLFMFQIVLCSSPIP